MSQVGPVNSRVHKHVLGPMHEPPLLHDELHIAKMNQNANNRKHVKIVDCFTIFLFHVYLTLNIY